MIDDTKQVLPKARNEQLIVKEVDDEVLVYDLKNDKAHCLNKVAAMVWKNCDGEKSITEIETALRDEAGTPVAEGVVWLALDQLKQFKLLAEVPSAPAVFAGMSRRQLVRTIGVTAFALPVIMSITSPIAVQAASCTCTTANCRDDGCPCGSNGQCIHKCNAGTCGP